MLYRTMRSALFCLDPETAHRGAVTALEVATAVHPVRRWLRRLCAAERPCWVLGLTFPNPVGLAAGYDKNAEHVRALTTLGFGFIEVGSVTARPARGTPRPRLFRLPEQRSLLNRMGLGSHGADVVADRLARLQPRPCRIFANIAKTPDASVTGDLAVDDYVYTFDRVAPYVDAVTLNLSCPNAAGACSFQHPTALAELLAAIRERQAAYSHLRVLVKLSPDLEKDQLREVAEACEHGADGIVMGNTTTKRPVIPRLGGLRREDYLSGGISGALLRPLALEKVRELRSLTRLPIIGVGGVSTAAHARALLDAGASLVQLFSGLVYNGPLTVKRVVEGLT